MKIGTVVLAGGKGRRIGGDKPTRTLCGKTLLDHVLERVGGSGPTAISIGRDVTVGACPRAAVLRDREDRGPIEGIASALRWAEEQALDAVLTVPVDAPFLPADLHDRLAAAVEDNRRAAIAASNGRLHPSCGLWTSDCLVALEKYVAVGLSLTGFSQYVHTAIVDWPVVSVDPFFNVNTPDDLALAEKFLRSR